MTPEEALNIVGQQIVNRIPDELRANGSYITGNLAKSYTYEVKQTKQGWTLNIIDNSGHGSGYNYGLSVDEGIERAPGGMPPPKSIENWIKVKKIVVPSGFTPEQFSWAIAKSIAKKGQRFRKPKPFIDPAINYVFQQDNEKIQQAAAVIVEAQLDVIFKK